MNEQTTQVNQTLDIKKLWNSFDRLILHKMQQKKTAELTLTSVQHAYYMSQLKTMQKHNPYYRGLEIKKMGDGK
jgi:hypothetical protein